MEIFTDAKSMQAQAALWKRNGESIAVVPTMGYLHEGHLSLIRLARQNATKVVTSIFVNPTQFGPTEDLDKYPRDFERDAQLCEETGVDAIFHPAPDAMYDPDFSCWVNEESLSKTLCGAFRPIHFRGVCTVCLKLFNITMADAAVFGRKDAQQLLVIERMVRDLNVPIRIIEAPWSARATGLPGRPATNTSRRRSAPARSPSPGAWHGRRMHTKRASERPESSLASSGANLRPCTRSRSTTST